MRNILIILAIGLGGLLSGCSGGAVTVPIGMLLMVEESNNPTGSINETAPLEETHETREFQALPQKEPVERPS